MMARLLFVAAALLMAACGGGVNLLPEPFTRERADGKIPVKTELIRQQVRAELAGMPEGEAEVVRWQKIETDYHACRLSSGKAKTAAEQVFADCMAKLGYVYMYPIDAEQLHNDIEFEMEKDPDKYIAAERKAEEKRIAAERKAEEERITAEKKRQEEQEQARRQKELDDALFVAVREIENGNAAKVKRLIDDGANVNVKDNDGLIPLHFAAGSGQPDIVKLLVKLGANINAKDKNGWSPLHYTASRGHADVVLVLFDVKANINARAADGRSPLHWAARQGHTNAALALVKAGAYVNSKTKDGITPLHDAIGESQINTALALIKAGANINAADKDRNTILHWAARFGQDDIALALIHAGAYINAVSNYKTTPRDVALHFQQWDVVAVLDNPPPPKPSGEQAPNVATAPAPEDSNVAEHVFEKAWRSVVYIETNGGQGGGVIIKPNIVATNCHVVDDGRIVVYKSHNRRTDKSKRYRATIRRRDDKNDFCLLDVSGLFGVPADVRRYDTLRIGESVYGIGAPQGLDLSLTSGLISQKRIGNGVRYIQTDTAISPGSSGGGLFDRKGNLVGIMTSKFVDEEVEGIGFAIPADLAL